MFCRKCGAIIPDYAKFCMACGERIINVTDEVDIKQTEKPKVDSMQHFASNTNSEQDKRLSWEIQAMSKNLSDEINNANIAKRTTGTLFVISLIVLLISFGVLSSMDGVEKGPILFFVFSLAITLGLLIGFIIVFKRSSNLIEHNEEEMRRLKAAIREVK